VKRLVETKCDQPVLKDAFLFCVLTGLRWSDIVHLTWEEVKGNAVDGWYLHFKQRKTKLYHALPITPQAKELLGERLESNRVIFSRLKYSSKTSIELCRWAIAAGVAKRITFHSAKAHMQLCYCHMVLPSTLFRNCWHTSMWFQRSAMRLASWQKFTWTKLIELVSQRLVN
jgi:hypothetical protein